MSAHETRLRELIEFMRADLPRAGAQAMESLDALLAEQQVAGLDGAVAVFSKRQAEVERQRVAAKSLPNETVADMKREVAHCSWAIHLLRVEKGRRKKGKEKTG